MPFMTGLLFLFVIVKFKLSLHYTPLLALLLYHESQSFGHQNVKKRQHPSPPECHRTENFLGNKRRLPTFHFPVLLSSWPTTFQFKSSVTTCHSPNGHGSKNLWGSCLTSPVLLDTIYDFGPYTTSPG